MNKKQLFIIFVAVNLFTLVHSAHAQSAAGNNNTVQFNSSGDLAGDDGFVYDSGQGMFTVSKGQFVEGIFDSDVVKAIDVENRNGLDVTGTDSFYWGDRTLNDHNGDVLLNWYGPKIKFADLVTGLSALMDTTAISSTDKTFTFPDASGTFALTQNDLSVFGSTTSSQLAGVISNETGSGNLVFSSNPTISSMTLSGAISGGSWNGNTVQIAYGGTNGTATPTAGAVCYGNGSSYAFTAAGTSGQILQSAGTSAPTWSTATFPSTAGSAGNYLRSNGTNFVSTAITKTQSTPSDPGITTSTTGVMMGLAGSITPVASGKVLVVISGDIDNSVAGSGAQVRIRYGTGSAPSNGDALTGTTAGALQKFVNPSLALLTPGRSPFSTQVILDGLSVNTAYWIDLELGAISSGTARIRDVSMSAVEL